MDEDAQMVVAEDYETPVTDTKLWRRPLVVERLPTIIRKTREDLGMSQRQFGNFLGVSKSLVTKMEGRNKIGLGALYSIWVNWSHDYHAAMVAGQIISQAYPDVPDNGKEE